MPFSDELYEVRNSDTSETNARKKVNNTGQHCLVSIAWKLTLCVKMYVSELPFEIRNT